MALPTLPRGELLPVSLGEDPSCDCEIVFALQVSRFSTWELSEAYREHLKSQNLSHFWLQSSVLLPCGSHG